MSCQNCFTSKIWRGVIITLFSSCCYGWTFMVCGNLNTFLNVVEISRIWWSATQQLHSGNLTRGGPIIVHKECQNTLADFQITSLKDLLFKMQKCKWSYINLIQIVQHLPLSNFIINTLLLLPFSPLSLSFYCLSYAFSYTWLLTWDNLFKAVFADLFMSTLRKPIHSKTIVTSLEPTRHHK